MEERDSPRKRDRGSSGTRNPSTSLEREDGRGKSLNKNNTANSPLSQQ